MGEFDKVMDFDCCCIVLGNSKRNYHKIIEYDTRGHLERVKEKVKIIC